MKIQPVQKPHAHAALAALLLISVPAVVNAAPAPVHADSVSAQGVHELMLPISRWGRYSLRCDGQSPVGLCVATRRSGVIACGGEAGQRNPRLDLFLDVGEYKLTLQGLPKAQGKSRFTALPFAPAAPPARLLMGRENRVSLDDLQEAGYWFEAKMDTAVYLEAVGRNLAELVLWRDGEWMVDIGRRQFAAFPSEEKPMSGIALAGRIPKGTYLLSAYGGTDASGTGRHWARASAEHPLFVQGGLERLAVNEVRTYTLSGKGFQQVLLPPAGSHVVIEAPDKKRLVAEAWELAADFAQAGWMATDSIHGKSASPNMMLSINGVQGHRLLRISGTPGQAFTVKVMDASVTHLEGKPGLSWWVYSLHSGNPDDQLGASGAVVTDKDGAVVAAQVDTVSPDREWARRFNLLDGMWTLVWIGADGKYALTPGGTEYTWRLRRFFHPWPPNYKEPEWHKGRQSVELGRGLHLLEFNPVKKGIASFVLGKSTLLGGMMAAGKAVLGAGEGDRKWDKPRPAVRFAGIGPAAGETWRVFFNSPGSFGVMAGRVLPIDLDTALGVWCAAGEKVSVPSVLLGKRNIRVTDEKGAPRPFLLDGRRAEGSAEAVPGRHTVELSGDPAGSRYLLLRAVEPELAADGPPPPFPDAARAAVPKFEPLRPGMPTFLDLDRLSVRPYALRVSEAGLYRIETTGRLAASLALSDRFRQFLRNASSNGVGRNALLIEYLLPGEYLVTAGTVENSAGHLGVAAYRNPLVEGGRLEEGLDNRKQVDAFSGAAYSVPLATAGRYRFESLGLQGNFPFRLEDKGGWPVDPAVASDPLEVQLTKGTYRLISLPTPLEGRRIARLTALLDQKAIKGKGPHELPLNVTLASTWVSTGAKGKPLPASAPVTPAVFDFDLPAPLTAKLTVTTGFDASLRADGSDSVLLAWSGTRKKALPMGRYRISLQPRKASNLVPYQVGVSTRELAPGLSHSLTRKETFVVTLGASGIVELGSQGMHDMTATLFDGDGKTVLAKNDDGYLDWNFAISRALKAGRYFLKVESAEPGFGETRVFMRALTDTLMPELASREGKPVTAGAVVGRRIGVFPIAEGDTAGILACAARGRSRLGLAMEASAPGGEWVPVIQESGTDPSLSLPRAPGRRYRAKVWAESGGDGPVEFSYVNATPEPADWKQAERGLAGETVPLGAEHRAWFKVDLGAHAPGHFRAEAQGPLSSIGASQALDQEFTHESPAWFASVERHAWIELRFEQAARFKVKLAPQILQPGPASVTALIGGGPRWFETPATPGTVGLLAVETDGARPLAGPSVPATASQGAEGDEDFRLGKLRVRSRAWIGEGRVATVLLPGDQARVALWNAQPPLDGSRPAARVSWTEMPLGEGGALPAGISAWSAKEPSARRFKLPDNASYRIRVALPPGGAAAFRRKDGSALLECSPGSEPSLREFHAQGGELFLLAPAAGAASATEARFDIAAFALAGGAGKDPKDLQALKALKAMRELAPGTAWQARYAGEGGDILSVKDAGGKAARLFFRGSIRAVEYFDKGGRYQVGVEDGTAVGPGGLLRVIHGEGWARMDLCDGSTSAEVMACKWAEGLEATRPAEISESSVHPLADGINWFRFSLKETRHVNLSAPAPGSVILLRGGKPVRYQEAWEKFNWDLPLDSGSYVLGVRPMAGASLERVPLSALFRPLETLSEKKPFTTFLAPGEGRLARFDVAKKDKFGLGLRQRRETVEARIYDSRGARIAQGKQQFLTLDPGTYHLWLRVPEGAEGTEVTAYLFGQEVPPNEPPESLVRWIVTGADGSRPTVSDDAEERQEESGWARLLQRDGSGSEDGGYPNRSEGGGGEGEGGEEVAPEEGSGGEETGEGESGGEGEGENGESGEGGENGGESGESGEEG